jgi:predicted TIM-barrel fold metal-dependent hydrolase
MDALGIRSALIDEFWTHADKDRRYSPGFVLPNGALRAVPSQAEQASNQYPDRFSYLVRIDFRDPLLDTLMQIVADTPHARAIRLVINKPELLRELAEGNYRRCFAAAENCGVPIFVITHGASLLLEPYLKEFTSVPVILDHIGMARRPGEFEEVLALASYRNVIIKWCHAEKSFDARKYPFPETDVPLRRTIATYGPDRIMWASDFTIRQPEYSWADRLMYIRNSSLLTKDEKTWILGRTARTVLNWPAPRKPWQPYCSVGEDYTHTQSSVEQSENN